MESTPSSDAAQAALRIRRGAQRMLADFGYASLCEFSLPDAHRADIASIGRAGDIVIIEVKSGLADFRADAKWPAYLAYCDRFYFAVDIAFPLGELPAEAGVIVADAYGAAIVREAEIDRIAAARRKALTLRFARTAARRLDAAGLSP